MLKQRLHSMSRTYFNCAFIARESRYVAKREQKGMRILRPTFVSLIVTKAQPDLQLRQSLFPIKFVR